MPITYNKIQENDNVKLAEVIRKVFIEFGVDKPGTVFTDPTTDALFELFQTPKSVYYVVKENDVILGGCGVFPTNGLPNGCTELVKFYLAKEARGKGIGRKLLGLCFETAKENGYKELYIESLPELEKAVGMYKKAGFKILEKPLGDSGHFACDVWMLKQL